MGSQWAFKGTAGADTVNRLEKTGRGTVMEGGCNGCCWRGGKMREDKGSDGIEGWMEELHYG